MLLTQKERLKLSELGDGPHGRVILPIFK